MYSIILLWVEDYIGRGQWFPSISETPLRDIQYVYRTHAMLNFASDIRKSWAVCHFYTSTFLPLSHVFLHPGLEYMSRVMKGLHLKQGLNWTYLTHSCRWFLPTHCFCHRGNAQGLAMFTEKTLHPVFLYSKVPSLRVQVLRGPGMFCSCFSFVL